MDRNGKITGTVYIIFAPMRSGSTYLADLLRYGGLFRTMALQSSYEALHESRQSDFLDGVSRSSLLEAFNVLISEQAVARREGQISGLKVLIGQWQLLSQQIGFAGIVEVMKQDAFHIIYLRRKDRLQQAVSCLRAWQEGLWHRKTWRTRVKSLVATYKKAEVIRTIAWIQRQEQWIEDFFTCNQLVFHPVYYEDLCNDPYEEIGRICAFMGQKTAEREEIKSARRKTGGLKSLLLSRYFHFRGVRA
jgi:LPS sulfotransferase NodH